MGIIRIKSKQEAKKEEDFAMKMRQNMYMSNFYGASNTVKLYSVVKFPISATSNK